MAMLGLFGTTGDASATPASVDYRRRLAERAGRDAFAGKFQGGKIPDIGVFASDPWAPAGMAPGRRATSETDGPGS